MSNKENIIVDKTFVFALNIIKLCKNLRNENEFIIANQLMKSGTSIGANVSEATAAQTKADFITKMAIASKEARETKYWLRLLAESGIIKNDITLYLKETDEIVNILTAIVKTSQKNR